jgi:histidinol-phosphate aminotransferase
VAMRLNSALDGLVAYKSGPPLDEIAAHYGLGRLVKLASNECGEGPFPEVVDAMSRELTGLNRYPDGGCDRLRAELSERLAVPPGHLVFGNGSCELLMILGQALLSPGEGLVYADPSFVMYHTIGVLGRARISAVPLRDHTHDLDAMAAAIGPDTRMVIVCNPNNPTGTLLPADALRAFLRAVPPDAVVVLDEAYVEFVTSPAYEDPVPWLQEHENLIVLRTFSKIYGLAGLRVGYGIANRGLIEALDKVRQPFNVTTLAQVAAAESLRHPDRLRARRDGTALERQRMGDALDRLGIGFVPSHANFLLIDVEGLPVPGKEVPQALLERGIMTRSGYAMGCPGRLRVTIGTEEENDLFLKQLAAIAAKGATP